MKRISRKPEKFEILDLFDGLALNGEFGLDSIADVPRLLKIIQDSVEKFKSPTMLFGRRTEMMFAYVVATLNKCALIKHEDQGDLYVQSNLNLIIPDYKVITLEGKQFFIEVKNCHTSNKKNTLKLQQEYIDGISTYCNLFAQELKFAVYWSSWNLWVLVSIEDFEHIDDSYEITLTDSITKNQMSILGDYLLGTTPPLSMKLSFQQSEPIDLQEPRSIRTNPSKLELLSKNNVLTDEYEKNLAFFLMQFSNWHNLQIIHSTPSPNIQTIEFIFSVDEPTEEQNFELLGYMSSMISVKYKSLTSPNGTVERFSPPVDISELGFSSPGEAKRDKLPLWIFSMSTSE